MNPADAVIRAAMEAELEHAIIRERDLRMALALCVNVMNATARTTKLDPCIGHLVSSTLHVVKEATGIEPPQGS